MYYNEGFGNSLPHLLLLLLKDLISSFSQLLIWCLHILNIYFMFYVFLQKKIMALVFLVLLLIGMNI